MCMKCHNDLNDDEKAVGMPLCQNCIESIVSGIKKKIAGVEEKKMKVQLENFSRYIISSGKLMGIDDITIMLACFDTFMNKTVDLKDNDIIFAEKIFTHAAEFINGELEKIKIGKESIIVSNDSLAIFVDDLMKRSDNVKDGDSKEKKESKKEGKDPGKRVDIE